MQREVSLRLPCGMAGSLCLLFGKTMSMLILGSMRTTYLEQMHEM